MNTRPTKWKLICALVLLVAAAASIPLVERWMTRDAEGRIFDLEAIPKRRVGLVLGCAENLYFHYRIEAAAELFHAGKIEYVLVSGDNHVAYYDEATAMRDALTRLGVPPDRIQRDHAGFSTIDSIIRAREVFGLERVTIISQAFHVRRALFIAKRAGLDAIGYSARSVETNLAARTQRREALARVKTVFDLYLFHRRPRFLGERIPIGEKAEEAPPSLPNKA